jgi:hypothetical protein
MNLNKFLGFYLKEALKILEKDGYIVEDIKLTKDPSISKTINDKSRIIKIDSFNEKNLRIIVC